MVPRIYVLSFGTSVRVENKTFVTAARFTAYTSPRISYSIYDIDTDERMETCQQARAANGIDGDIEILLRVTTRVYCSS